MYTLVILRPKIRYRGQQSLLRFRMRQGGSGQKIYTKVGGAKMSQRLNLMQFIIE